MIIAISLLNLFFKYKTIGWRKYYYVYLLFLYRDITLFILAVLVLLHDLLDIHSYILYAIPVLSLLGVYAFESMMSYRIFLIIKAKGPQELNSTNEGLLYIETVLRNSSFIKGNTMQNRGIAVYNEGTKEAERILYNILAAHQKDCEDTGCLCKEIFTIKSKLNSESNNNTNLSRVPLGVDEKGWKQFGKKLISDLIAKYPRHTSLYILSACVEYNDLRNKYKTLFNLRKAEEMKPSLAEQLDINYLQDLVEQKMMGKSYASLIEENSNARWHAGTSNITDSVSTKRLNRFMTLYNKFMDDIETCSNNSVNFWNILLMDSPDPEKLNAMGNSISASLKRIHTMYNKAIETNTVTLNFVFKYCIFLRHIVYDDITANMVSSKYFYRIYNINRLKTLKNKSEIGNRSRIGAIDFKNDKLMLMKMSGDKATLGKIIDVNFELSFQLKYEKEDLIGSHIRKLLPTTIADSHDDWMLSAYDTMKFNRLDNITYGFVREKSGYFQPITLVVKEISNLKEGLAFLAALQINKKLTGYLKTTEMDQKKLPCIFLCEKNGHIVGINEETAKVFKMSALSIERETELFIDRLFPVLLNNENYRIALSKDGLISEVNIAQISDYNLENDIIETLEDQGTSLNNDTPLRFQKRNILCHINIVTEEHGKFSNIPKFTNVVIAVPIKTIKTVDDSSNALIRSGEISRQAPSTFCQPDNQKVEENEQDAIANEMSVSSSVTSSGTSHTSDTNAVREFKLSLYELKYPAAVTLLKYTLWLLIVVLLTISIIDWVISFQKVKENSDCFSAVHRISGRLDLIGMVTQFTRTLDLIIEYFFYLIELGNSGDEEDTFFGVDNSELTRELVFFLILQILLA